MVKARVVNVDSEKRRILLSLREADDQAVLTRKADKEESGKVKDVICCEMINFFRWSKSISPPSRSKSVKLESLVHGDTARHLRLQLLNFDFPAEQLVCTLFECIYLFCFLGRLHVSELDLNESADGTSPMIEFLNKNQGKNVEVKVICVGNRKTITDAGKAAIEKKCGVNLRL